MNLPNVDSNIVPPLQQYPHSAAAQERLLQRELTLQWISATALSKLQHAWVSDRQ